MLPAAMLIVAAILIDPYIQRGKWVGRLKYLGDISYSTYLVHVLVFGICLHLATVANSRVSDYLLLPLLTILIAMLSHYSFTFIETGSLSRYLKNRLAGRKV